MNNCGSTMLESVKLGSSSKLPPSRWWPQCLAECVRRLMLNNHGVESKLVGINTMSTPSCFFSPVPKPDSWK